MDQRTTWWITALAVASVGVVSCGGDDEAEYDGPGKKGGGNNTNTGGNPGTGGGTAGGGTAGGGVGGAPGPCNPGDNDSCYTGDPATLNVGLCVAGQKTCGQDSLWGPCIGEVTPVAETCSTQGDDDCDGLTNEEGPDCQCAPGAPADCYSGPPNTLNVGICHGGTQYCNQQGTGYGPCLGEVTPGVEDCNTPDDEDCDGLTPPCPTNDPIIDLRADVNR